MLQILCFLLFIACKFQLGTYYKLLMDYLQTSILAAKKQDIEAE